MFIPRSIVRKQPKQIESVSSKIAVDEVSNTPDHSVVQSQKSDSLETFCHAAADNATTSSTGQGNQTISRSTSPQHDRDQSPLRDGAGGPVTLTDHTSRSQELDSNDSESSDDEPVLSFSKQQRWPAPGEPVCVVCGRYGAYIIDRTNDDICSLECKAKHLIKLGIHLVSTVDGEECAGPKENDDGDRFWVYREHPEVTSMTTAQCNALYKLHDVKVKGEQAPRPVSGFHQLSLPHQSYNDPTAVQMFTIPMALTRRDLLICAPTGSGKTLSFLLPLITLLVRTTKPSDRTSPRFLVLAPTRELAMQIENQSKQLMRGIPCMKTALLVGGLPIAQQLHRLKSAVQMIIATPARLIDIIDNHPSGIDLADIEALVLDEVDCLLQMGFEPQVRKIESFLPAKRQNLLFSATIPPQVERMAVEFMKEPLYAVVGKPSAPCEFLKHTVLWVEETSKRKKLVAFLNDSKRFRPPAVVFVSSKMGTLFLAEAINKLCPHLSVVAMHGDMAQEKRTAVVEGLLEGRYSLVVATNVLGRGVDLPNVRQVFVFDMPSSLLEFIHQVGRAGHVGSPGWAVSFINNECKSIFADLVELLNPFGVQLPPQLTHSPHLSLQQEQRKLRVLRSVKMVDDTRPHPPSKKRKTRDDYIHSKESLIDLIKSVRRHSDC